MGRGEKLKMGGWNNAWAGVGLLIAMAMNAFVAHGQSAPLLPSASRAAVAFDAVLREIDDVSTGDRWLLLRSSNHPGAPGRLVLVSGPGKKLGPATADTLSPAVLAAIKPTVRLVIHARDYVIVEEHTALVDARLEAVALGSAASDAPLRVRLKVGGKIVGAVATGPGHAILAPEAE